MIAYDEFRPTREMLNCAKDILIKKAYVDTIKPVILGIQKDVLEQQQYRNEVDNKIITDPKYDWTMGLSKHEEYCKLVSAKYRESGFEFEEAYCPLLIAEHDLRIANSKLVDSMEQITNISKSDLISKGLDKYNDYIDITLKLLINYIDRKEFKISL